MRNIGFENILHAGNKNYFLTKPQAWLVFPASQSGGALNSWTHTVFCLILDEEEQ